MINIKRNYAFTVSSCTKCDGDIQENASRIVQKTKKQKTNRNWFYVAHN